MYLIISRLEYIINSTKQNLYNLGAFMGNFRIERDSIGEKQVPIDTYYGVQSLRTKENFKISGKYVH